MRFRWFYPLLVAVLFIGSPSEPLKPIHLGPKPQVKLPKPDVFRIAVVPDFGSMQIKDGKQIGMEYAMLQAWRDSCSQPVEWFYARSASEALSWLRSGKVDLAAGNLPNSAQQGLSLSSAIRTFEWVQLGDSDTLRWLAEYPIPDELLGLTTQRPSIRAEYAMWRHMPCYQNGWIIPDYLFEVFDPSNPPNNKCSIGTFHWFVRSSDVALLEEVESFLESPRAEKIKSTSKAMGLKAKLGMDLHLSPFDDLFYNNPWDDPYTVMALAYIESRYTANAASQAGAIGLMQLMPSTAEKFGVDSLDLYNPERNLHGGVKYLGYLDRYWIQKGVRKENRMPFILASYNTGPTPVWRAAKRAAGMGLDSTIWLHHVDQVATGPGARYASNVMRIADMYRGYTLSIRRSKRIPSKTENR